MTSAGVTGLWPQIRADQNGMNYRPAGGVFAIEGTVYPGAPFPPRPITDDGQGWWAGFASGAIGGLINQADGLWYTECIGYPAVTTPMWPSALIGQANASKSIRVFADVYKARYGVFPPISIVAWSQGAIVSDLVWTRDILPEGGYLHDLLPYILTIYNYGDVLRCPGLSYGNDYAGLTPPGKLDGQTTGGIGGPLDLTPDQTNYQSPLGRPTILSFNNAGDLYGAAPVGDNPWKSLPAAAKTEYNFFRIIMQPGAADIIQTGLGFFNIVGDVEGGWNAAKFFSAGQNAPHFKYWDAMTWIVNDLVRIGHLLPHAPGF